MYDRRGSACQPEASMTRIVPCRTAAQAPEPGPGPLVDTGGVLSEDEWHLLFNAVKSRLRTVVDNPATAATVIPECLEALDWLQHELEMRAHRPTGGNAHPKTFNPWPCG
jgi:hypothetical protein